MNFMYFFSKFKLIQIYFQSLLSFYHSKYHHLTLIAAIILYLLHSIKIFNPFYQFLFIKIIISIKFFSYFEKIIINISKNQLLCV